MLTAVAVIGIGLAAAGDIWSQARQREKETELLFVGNQFRQAIALYERRTPGAARRFPEKLQDLLLDKRYPNVQRYLRKIYADPMTGKPEWGLVTAPDGGIMGVYSLSEDAPLKTANFSNADHSFEGKTRYSEWKFVYAPSTPVVVPPSK